MKLINLKLEVFYVDGLIIYGDKIVVIFFNLVIIKGGYIYS